MMFSNKLLTLVFLFPVQQVLREFQLLVTTHKNTHGHQTIQVSISNFHRMCMPFDKFLNSFLFSFSPGVRFVSESSRSFLTSNSTSGLTLGTNLTSAGTRDAPSSSLSCPTYSHTPGPATMTINCTHRISLKNNSFDSLSIHTMSFQSQLKTCWHTTYEFFQDSLPKIWEFKR